MRAAARALPDVALSAAADALLLFALALLLGAPLSRPTAAWAAAQALLTSAPLAAARALDDSPPRGAASASAAAAFAAPGGGLALLLRADAPAVAWRRRLLVAPALASLAGAWLGACLLPYDWALPWQTWPETSLRGGAAGFLAGAAAAAASRCAAS